MKESWEEKFRAFRDWHNALRQDVKKVFKDNTKFHVFVIVLVITDVLLTFGELIIDLEVVRNNRCHSDSDCPLLRRANASDPFSRECIFNASLSKCRYWGGAYRCVEDDTVEHLKPEYIIHIAGLVVLGIFVVEVAIKIWAFGPDLLNHKLEVFDSVISVMSFTTDVAFSGKMVGFGLLILLRLWRFARIFNGIMILIEDKAKQKRDKLAKSCKMCQGMIGDAEKKAQSWQNDYEELKKKNEDLQRQLDALRQASAYLDGRTSVEITPDRSKIHQASLNFLPTSNTPPAPDFSRKPSMTTMQVDHFNV